VADWRPRAKPGEIWPTPGLAGRPGRSLRKGETLKEMLDPADEGVRIIFGCIAIDASTV
jgi:hypothetical protein